MFMNYKTKEVYTKTKPETRSSTGNFLPFREVRHYKGFQCRKHHVCACCHHRIEAERSSTAIYCSSCITYIQKMR